MVQTQGPRQGQDLALCIGQGRDVEGQKTHPQQNLAFVGLNRVLKTS